MSAVLARIVLIVAMASLGPHRRDWALAMAAEFDEAAADGRGLSFATGCLATAWRALPAHIDGRRLLARYIVILGVLLPAAALLLIGTLAGYPYVHPPYADMIGAVAMAEPGVPRVHAGNVAAMPAFAFLLMLRVGSDLLVAWFAAERDWDRVAAAQRVGAAATVTLALFAGVVVLDETCTVLPALTFAVELLAIALLRRLHRDADALALARRPT